MRKLTLQPDDLQVDSFDPHGAPMGEAGTVRGYFTAPDCVVYPGDPQPRRTDPQYEASCDISCVYGSCLMPCGSGYMCSDADLCKDPDDPTV